MLQAVAEVPAVPKAREGIGQRPSLQAIIFLPDEPAEEREGQEGRDGEIDIVTPVGSELEGDPIERRSHVSLNSVKNEKPDGCTERQHRPRERVAPFLTHGDHRPLPPASLLLKELCQPILVSS